MSAPLRRVAGLGQTLVLASVRRTYSCFVGRQCLTAVEQHTACLQPKGCLLNITRNINFFNEMTGEDLWRGVTSVSNAGRKRGRAKRVGKKKLLDLNRGQVIGTGKANIQWPGLNIASVKGRTKLERQQLPPDPQREEKLIKLREGATRFRAGKIAPLQRGWTGGKSAGQSVGPPEPVGEYKFDDFDSRMLELKIVCNMTGTLGKKHSFSAFVAVGNGNGIAGYGLGRAQNGRAATKIAKKRAAQNLMYIPRFEDRTVFHNMYTKFHHTKIFIHKKEEGYGLRAHKAVVTLCKLMGLKDLHCKVEGNTKNTKAVTKALFEAVINQETHQQLADRMSVHVIEQRKERLDLPVIVASPVTGVISDKKLQDEEEDVEMDYDRMYAGGKIELERPPVKPSFYKLKSHRFRRATDHIRRNQPQAHLLRQAGQW